MTHQYAYSNLFFIFAFLQMLDIRGSWVKNRCCSKARIWWYVLCTILFFSLQWHYEF